MVKVKIAKRKDYRNKYEYDQVCAENLEVAIKKLRRESQDIIKTYKEHMEYIPQTERRRAEEKRARIKHLRKLRYEERYNNGW